MKMILLLLAFITAWNYSHSHNEIDTIKTHYTDRSHFRKTLFRVKTASVKDKYIKMRLPKMRWLSQKGYYQMVDPENDSVVMSEGFAIHGRKDGEWKYYDNGVLVCARNYSKGKRHGPSTEYDQHGEVDCIYEYKMDTLINKTCPKE